MATRENPTHSPAPWTLDETRIRARVRDANGAQVATVDGTGADERLVVKSPELLAACRAFVLDADPDSLFRHRAYMKALIDHIDGGSE